MVLLFQAVRAENRLKPSLVPKKVWQKFRESFVLLLTFQDPYTGSKKQAIDRSQAISGLRVNPLLSVPFLVATDTVRTSSTYSLSRIMDLSMIKVWGFVLITTKKT